ncbi:hypothetical protein EJ03DRAFT_336057 [Teratosphaeria nubilosa]|uniref:BON domain-containing protein n=1 Tax=Teratosphaeria nubilosa TaxID=161662 RepID=A0A6G1LA41_9PEZI|nr:hypothetical protein EJ03DRAFT_336057 [Teratosphaeria nubilosa]
MRFDQALFLLVTLIADVRAQCTKAGHACSRDKKKIAMSRILTMTAGLMAPAVNVLGATPLAGAAGMGINAVAMNVPPVEAEEHDRKKRQEEPAPANNNRPDRYKSHYAPLWNQALHTSSQLKEAGICSLPSASNHQSPAICVAIDVSWSAAMAHPATKRATLKVDKNLIVIRGSVESRESSGMPALEWNVRQLGPVVERLCPNNVPSIDGGDG